MRSGAFVPYRRAPEPSRLDRHRSFIEERWQEGQRNSAALYRDLQALGFDGGYDIVRRWAIRRRQRMQVGSPSARKQPPQSHFMSAKNDTTPFCLEGGGRRIDLVERLRLEEVLGFDIHELIDHVKAAAD